MPRKKPTQSPDARLRKFASKEAWDNACLLFGRFGSVMQRSAFEQYLDELAGIVK